eukprot:Amastigsp_a508598_96.p2 type:complete len:121 gc:universal Amastigsp_a508598_96:435-73(-)
MTFDIETSSGRSSSVRKLTRAPARASASEMCTFATRLSPSRSNRACGFVRTTNLMSAGIMPGSSSPSFSKVTAVPSFQPGWTSTVNTLAASICRPDAPSNTLRVILSFLVTPVNSSSRVT